MASTTLKFWLWTLAIGIYQRLEVQMGYNEPGFELSSGEMDRAGGKEMMSGYLWDIIVGGDAGINLNI